MGSVAELLLQSAQNDPLPVSHASSHWLQHGAKTVVAYRNGEWILRPSGFSARTKVNWAGRILLGFERWSYAKITHQLKSWPHVWRLTKQLTTDLGVALSRHEWSSAVVMAILADHFTTYHIRPRTFALIGDGDGFLGSLAIRLFSDCKLKVYTIELPKALVFQALTYETACPQIPQGVFLPEMANQLSRIPSGVTFVHPDLIEQIDDTIDCAVNLVSMQEMKTSSIAAYFQFLRRRSGKDSRFYCVNRVHNRLPGGEETKFLEYPWREYDEVFIDDLCPYFVHFLDFHRYPKGPKFLGMRIPWINYFNGSSMHRLVHLAAL